MIVSAALTPPKVFARKPLSFLQKWLAIRRKGQNFDQTPMGFVCQGKILLESHHFFARVEAMDAAKKFRKIKGGLTNGERDGEEVGDDFSDGGYGDEIDVDALERFDDNQLLVVEDSEDQK